MIFFLLKIPESERVSFKDEYASELAIMAIFLLQRAFPTLKISGVSPKIMDVVL